MRILFVAPVHSVIAARWVEQLADTGWDIYVYGTQTGPIHPSFRNVTLYTNEKRGNIPQGVRHVVFQHCYPLKRGRTRLRQFFPSIANILDPEPPHYIAQLIRKLRPNIVHSLKMQNEGYYMLDVKRQLGNAFQPLWIHSLWGSDIFMFKESPIEVSHIKSVLANCDYILAGNSRDLLLAREYGYLGEILGELPSGGGWPIAKMRAFAYQSPSKRKIIAIKGYQAGRGGKVLTALDALALCGSVIKEYTIIIHSAIDTYASQHFTQVRQKAEELSRTIGVSIDFLPYSPPEKIWELFGQSRVAIGISDADGTPNTMLEAMIMGAYPIQSNTGGLETWITSNINGSLVPAGNDPITIARLLERALSDDELVDSAAIINLAKTAEKIDRVAVQNRAIDIYKTLAQKNL